MFLSIVLAMALLMVVAFVSVGITAQLSEGRYSENTFMYRENAISSNVQDISSATMSIDILLPLLVMALLVLIVIFAKISAEAYGSKGGDESE